jgi:ABC-2 type transport system ATP-binding protein
MAQALINEPRMLICDEPTSALDPAGRKDVLDILKRIKGGTTVIFSTHILSDVERICDRAAILIGGRIALEGTLAGLRERRRPDSVYIEFESAGDKGRFMRLFPNGLTNITEQSVTELTLKATDIKALRQEILRVLSVNEIFPAKFETMEPTIESLYLEVA